MALALKKVGPFARRALAWWNGIELPSEAPPPSAPCAAAPVKASLPPLVSDRKSALWTDPRSHLIEQVWGAGFGGPVDAEWVARFVAPLALNSKMTAINLGAGLGGVARATTLSTGTWVTGYEAKPELVEAGMELSTLEGLAKRAPILPFDFAKPSLKRESCNAVIAINAFYTLADKAALYSAMFDALRVGGHVLFADYMAIGNKRDTPAFQEWLKLEGEPVHLSSPDETKAALAAAQFDVRIVEDVSPEMRHLITLGWARFAEALRQTNFDRRLGVALADELALWLARLRVLESREVGVFRVHAIKLNAKAKG